MFYTYGMLYSLTGAVISKGDNFLVLEAAGIGFKVHTNQRTLDTLREGASAKLFSHLQVKEDSMGKFIEVIQSNQGITLDFVSNLQQRVQDTTLGDNTRKLLETILVQL